MPQPEVVWLKDNKPIENSDRYIIESKGNIKNLVIKKTEPSDIGIFTIHASNEAGEDSSSATLSVKGNSILRNTENILIFRGRR